jgi:hypothetical protein
MAQGDVADLVRHNTGQLGFVARRFERAAVDVNEAARQGEGVDLAHVHHAELVGESFAGRFPGQPLAERAKVSLDIGARQEAHLPLDLRCRLAADLNVLLGREEVEAGLELRDLLLPARRSLTPPLAQPATSCPGNN